MTERSFVTRLQNVRSRGTELFFFLFFFFSTTALSSISGLATTIGDGYHSRLGGLTACLYINNEKKMLKMQNLLTELRCRAPLERQFGELVRVRRRNAREPTQQCRTAAAAHSHPHALTHVVEHARPFPGHYPT